MEEGTLSAMLEAVVARTVGAQLASVADKLDALDARLGAVEARVEARVEAAKGGSRQSQYGEYSAGVQAAAAQAAHEQLVALAAQVAALGAVQRRAENALGDAVDNMAWALEQHAVLVAEAKETPTQKTSTPEEKADVDVDAFAARLAALEAAFQARVPESLGDGLRQIAKAQQALEADVRALVAAVHSTSADAATNSRRSTSSLSSPASSPLPPPPADPAHADPAHADPALAAALADMQLKIDRLPQIYVDQVAISLQKQTTELLRVIDLLKPAPAAAAPYARRVFAAPNPSNPNTSSPPAPPPPPAQPLIPNMGIADRFSRLASIARNRLSNEVVPANSPVLTANSSDPNNNSPSAPTTADELAADNKPVATTTTTA